MNNPVFDYDKTLIEEDKMMSALVNNDFSAAKPSAESAYRFYFELSKDESDPQKKTYLRDRLSRLSTIIDEINEQLIFGGQIS